MGGASRHSAISAVVDLEALGYLRRRPDPSDGRAKLIEFTKRGWDSVEVALTSFAAIEAELADDIGAARMRELRRTLVDLVAATSP